MTPIRRRNVASSSTPQRWLGGPRSTGLDAVLLLLGLLVLIVVIVGVLIVSPRNRPTSTVRSSSLGGQTVPISPRDGAVTSSSGMSSSSLETGRVNDVDYYRCRRRAASTAATAPSGNGETVKPKTLLLFHGAAFTKENWRESGILSLLCSNPEADGNEKRSVSSSSTTTTHTLDVYAFDLPVKATPHDLKSLLDTMVQQGTLHSLPVDAIVTPSASGKMVVEWNPPDLISTSSSTMNWPPLSKYASMWMPIASPAVASVQNPQQQYPIQFNGVTVVAVHGDQDAGGKRTMNLLASSLPGSSDVVEMKGRHPCYLDSPHEFVELVLERLHVA